VDGAADDASQSAGVQGWRATHRVPTILLVVRERPANLGVVLVLLDKSLEVAERTVLGDLLLLKIKEPRLTRDRRYDQDVERSLVFRRVGLLGLGLGLADRLHVGHGT
jgi:hypothetical protein